MKLFVPILLAGLLLVNAAHAADWTIDKSRSMLGFSGTQTSTKFSGSFGSFGGQIAFDPANPAAVHAEITIEMASATTGDKQRDEAIPGADWFDAGKFPQAKFEITSFKSLGGNKYEAMGTLSIRDVSKNVMLPFTLTIAGDKATADGTLPLTRTDYGVGQGDWTSGQWVGLEVDVTLHIEATKAN